MGKIFPLYSIADVDNIPQEMSDTVNGLEVLF
jgi:hypothetical protein